MQRVKMLATVPGSIDGITQTVFREGHQYDMPDDMVRSLISEGLVELVFETKPEPALETAAPPRRGRK